MGWKIIFFCKKIDLLYVDKILLSHDFMSNSLRTLFISFVYLASNIEYWVLTFRCFYCTTIIKTIYKTEICCNDIVLAFANSYGIDLTNISITVGWTYDNKEMSLVYVIMKFNNSTILTTQMSANKYFVAIIIMMILRMLCLFLFLRLNDFKTLETISFVGFHET